MAEAANNIVPLTGSPLSRASRENISAQITSFNSFISEQRNFNSQKSRADDYQNVLIQGGQNSVTSLQNQLDGISRELSTLSQNVNSISQTVQQQGTAEQLRLRSEQENQRRLAQKKIAIGKENELEQRIQSALTSPVVAVQAKVSDLFGRVEAAFTTLFLGWLGNAVIKYLKAQSEGDIDKLGQIQKQIITGLGIGVGSLVLVKTGLSLVSRAITSAVGGVASLIAKIAAMPFRALGAGIRGLGGGGPKVPTPGSKPGPKGGKFNVLGGIITATSMALDFLNGENVDAALKALTIAPIGGKFGAGLKVVAGTVVTLDEIAEFLGSNLTGANPELLRQKREELKKAQSGGKDTSTTPTQSTPKPPQGTPTSPTSVAPPEARKGGKTPEGAAPQSQQPKIQPSTTMAPAASSLTMNVNASSSQVPDTAPAKEKNVDTDTTAPSAPSQTQFPDYSGIFSPTAGKEQPKMTPAAKITPPPKDMSKAGALPEVQPNVVVATDSSTAAPQQAPQPKPSSVTDAPAISSSNPDNFYVLYSQLNYNVVV